jgi:cellulose synthase/poly-beta-1,6-N-acetylglucosamine synthase-like glycosyltransferase
MEPFFLVLARDRRGVEEKSAELDALGVPYTIVCGEPLPLLKVVYRRPMGKYDAINFGVQSLGGAEIICLNDVDTRIHNFHEALKELQDDAVGLVYCKVVVKGGPQPRFYRLLDAIRGRIHVAASGELMVLRRGLLEKVVPLPPCKAEDSYILFRALELGYIVVFSRSCFVTTRRTETLEEEAAYKRRTVSGIYQALSYAKPPPLIRLFYPLLPFVAPLLLVLGRTGYYWTKGIVEGAVNLIRRERGGVFDDKSF